MSFTAFMQSVSAFDISETRSILPQTIHPIG